MMDHRRIDRHRTFTLIEILGHTPQNYTGLVYNINRYGAFILSTTAPKVDSIVEISLLICTNSKLQLPVPGIVIHRNRNGFGLLFFEQKPVTLLFVESLTYRYSLHAHH